MKEIKEKYPKFCQSLSYKKKKVEILELKNTITKITNSVYEWNGKLERSKVKISWLANTAEKKKHTLTPL